MGILQNEEQLYNEIEETKLELEKSRQHLLSQQELEEPT